MSRIVAPLLGALLIAGCGSTPPPKADFGTRIAQADAEPQNWLSTGRTYQEGRFSPLDQINDQTIGRLSLAWSYDLDTARGQEATPIVVDGRLYTTSAWSKVQAFDAATGRLLWQYDPQVPLATGVKACCDVINRGAAYWDGRVYVGTLDGRLISLDARTGRVAWSVQTVDSSLHYAVTGAPRIVKGRVIIGNGGAEFGVRGYVSAYDAETGKRVWRFYTVPGEPGKADGEISDRPLAELAQPGWSGQWWTEAGGRGGGTVWDSMAYDPDLDLLYLGVGNASYWNKAYRSPGDGDNLFVASVLALRPETGEYVWHYQESPGDTWDYTSSQHMILTDLTIDGRVRKVLLHAPKNGYFFVLDRATGSWADPAKVHTIDHAGRFFKSRGPFNVVPAPGAGPVLSAAGQSDRGLDFVAKHADVSYGIQWTGEAMRAHRDRLHEKSAKFGREADAVKILWGVKPFVGATEEAAKARQRAAIEAVPVRGALEFLKGFGFDYDSTTIDLDTPIDDVTKGRFSEGLRQAITETLGEKATVGDTAVFIASGNAPHIVGTPEQVATRLEELFEAAGGDGFLINIDYSLESISEFVDTVVPVLQARGVYRTDYAGTTLREHVQQDD